MYSEPVGEPIKQIICGVKELIQKDALKQIKPYLETQVSDATAIIKAMPSFECEEVMLYADEDVTVYYIATPSKILYPPHEHGMIAISALYKGTETHVFYDRDNENIKERTRVKFSAPSVVALKTDVIHAICTDDDVANEGIHFYLGNLENQKRTMWDVSGRNPRQYVHDDYLQSAKAM